MRQNGFYSILILMTTLFFCACKKTDNFSSRITFFNTVINSSSTFSLKADSISIADKIGYDSLKANTITPSGTFTVRLFSNNVLLLPFTTNLQANESYTAVVYDSSQRAKFFMRKDVYPATPGYGRCAIRIYTLIPDAVNLYLANDTAKPFITGKTFNDFATGATSPAFTEIDTILRPRVLRDNKTLVDSLKQPLRSGKIYTLYITGSIKDSARLPPKLIVQMHN